jgi:hypothetical protein
MFSKPTSSFFTAVSYVCKIFMKLKDVVFYISSLPVISLF